MRLDSAHLDHARKVADAILYEGYLLYPYHRSSQKNQLRFQFGVLMPPAYGAIDACEPSASQTECLLECPDDAEVRILLRFLQLQRRTVYGVSPDTGELHKIDTLYVDGSEFTEWYEAAEREQHATATMAALLGEDKNIEFHIGAGESAEELTDSLGRKAGRLVRRWSAIDGVITIHAERADCTDLLLSSPVILYDHPEIAAESAGDLFDATEIDEILTLRTLALTDSEKRQARATDPLAAELIDRLDGLPPEMLERMHGAIRYLRPAGGPAARQPGAPTPRTCSWPGVRPRCRRCCTTSTARCTWRTARTTIPRPSCSVTMAGSSTSRPTRSSPSSPPGPSGHPLNKTGQ